MELPMALTMEPTPAAEPRRAIDPAASELDDLTPLRAASTAEASEIPNLEDSRSTTGGECR
jgi:hypothetical protein